MSNMIRITEYRWTQERQPSFLKVGIESDGQYPGGVTSVDRHVNDKESKKGGLPETESRVSVSSTYSFWEIFLNDTLGSSTERCKQAHAKNSSGAPFKFLE